MAHFVTIAVNKNIELKKYNLKLKIKNLKLRKQGFSLVELMFAMVFLSVIIFGVLKLQTSNLTVSNTNKNELQANFYANQGIEIVKSIGFTVIDDKGCTDSFVLSGYGLGDCEPAEADYEIPSEPFKRYFNVSAMGTPTDAYKVTSVIQWTDSTGAHNLTDGGAVQISQIIF